MSPRWKLVPKGAPAPSESKRCTKCGEVKPLAAFKKRTYGHTLKSWCSPCEIEWQLQHQAGAPPKSSAELMTAGKLSAAEKMLVLRCVDVLVKNEQSERARLKSKGSRYRHGRREPELSKVEKVLVGIPWRRQVTLMSCSVALARESGVTFAYTKNSSTAKRIREEQSA